jgi:1,4-alpha-glucan branching enzyme
MKKLGNFVLVLHTHLPFVVHHGKWPHGMEWLFEAASETYIPLLNALNELVAEGIRPKLTISLTPVLAEQLASPAFVDAFHEFLAEEITRADKDIAYFETTPAEANLLALGRFWKRFYTQIAEDFEHRYHTDLVGAFRDLQDEGVLDVITCGATHGYFPLLGTDESIQAQVRLAKAVHEKHLGEPPRGIWLPECAYRPRYAWKSPVLSVLGKEPFMRKGIEEILEETGLEYFIVDSSLVEAGKFIPMYLGRFEALRGLMARWVREQPASAAQPAHSVYEVYLVKSSTETHHRPAAAFARDVETSMQVWSSEQGYPGGEWYLDFHKKHHLSGHRYWRVTSIHADLGLKTLYEPHRIEDELERDAEHFVQSVRDALARFRDTHGTTGTLTAPFDSELFGHWWFEGPRFLKKVFEKLANEPDIEVKHCAGVMDDDPPQHVIALPEGSWGAGGNHYVWLNDEVAWMWKHVYEDELILRDLARRAGAEPAPDAERVLKQMVRELLLVEASDWPFLISTKSAVDYATRRFIEHHHNFSQLAEMAGKCLSGDVLSKEDERFLDLLVKKNFLFDADLIHLDWYR